MKSPATLAIGLVVKAASMALFFYGTFGVLLIGLPKPF